MRAHTVACALALMAVSAAFPQAEEWLLKINQAKAAEFGGDYRKAAALFRDAAKTAARFDPTDSRRVTAWNDLGTMEDALGHFADAEADYRRALRAAEQVGGKMSSAYAAVLSNLGGVSAEVGQTAAAERMLREALAIQRKSNPADEVRVAVAQDSLAGVLSVSGRLDEAESLLRASTAVLERHPAAWDETALTLNELAVVSFLRGNCREAERFVHRSVNIVEERVGPDHPMLVRPLNDLATIMAHEGEPTDAAALLRRAMAIAEKSIGTDNRLYGRVLANYAFCLRRTGEKAQAKAVQAQAVQILKDSALRNGIGATIDITALRSK